MNQDTYVKIFLKASNQALSEENSLVYSRKWFVNVRKKEEGGLRLTDEGLKFVKDILDLKVHEVPFPATLDLKPQVILFLDKFIDCPYHLTEDSITVLSERKSFELHLFSGDVRQYGLMKAMKRKKSNQNS
jgi:hypothetical protein